MFFGSYDEYSFAAQAPGAAASESGEQDATNSANAAAATALICAIRFGGTMISTTSAAIVSLV
jgi:hypothetical protein